jgi:pimeloyl-ACP methyl ester carboxylesterase
VLRSLWDNRHHWDEFLDYADQITVPVHFLIGADDPISGERDTRDMAALLKNADVTVLPGVGHAAPLETSRTVADAVRRVLVASR